MDVQTHIISDEAFAGTAKGLDGKGLAFLHLRLISSFHDRHALATVDTVGVDVVSVQVSDALHRERRPPDLHLVALHHLLNGGANVAHAHVDPRFLCSRQLNSLPPAQTTTGACHTLTPVLVASLTAAKRLS